MFFIPRYLNPTGNKTEGFQPMSNGSVMSDENSSMRKTNDSDEVMVVATKMPLPDRAQVKSSEESSIPQSHRDGSGESQIGQIHTPVQDQINLDRAKRLDVKSFPDAPQGRYQELPATIPNVQHLLKSYGIVVRYNSIKKKLQITLPVNSGSADNADNTAMTQLISLANLNNIPIGQIPSFVELLGDRNFYNPVADWIKSKAWDGVDRLPEIYGTLVVREGFPEDLKNTLLRKWLLSAVAAALKPSGFRGRGVLTFQGPQGIGKTSWVASLVPDPILRDMVIKLDHHLDPNSKDSILGAISHWIVEIGELDSSFKKDVARLKGVLTSDSDKVRRPYARTESEYPRRTVFFATVNDNNFLVDSTGNTRWWTIPLVSIKYQHGIDMQQIYAQLSNQYEEGEQWWLNNQEESLLEFHNRDHRSVSVIREMLVEFLDLDREVNSSDEYMQASQVLKEIGIEYPSNAQNKECGGILRELIGDPKKVKGLMKWRVPLRSNVKSPLKHEPITEIGEF